MRNKERVVVDQEITANLETGCNWKSFEEGFLEVFSNAHDVMFRKTIASEMKWILIESLEHAKEIPEFSYLGKKGVFGVISHRFARLLTRDLVSLKIPSLVADDLRLAINPETPDWRAELRENHDLDNIQIRIVERLLKGPFDVDIKLNISPEDLQELAKHIEEKFMPKLVLIGDSLNSNGGELNLRVPGLHGGGRYFYNLTFRKFEFDNNGTEKTVLEFEFSKEEPGLDYLGEGDKFSIQITNIDGSEKDARLGSGMPDSQRKTLHPIRNLHYETEDEDDWEIMIGSLEHSRDILSKSAKVEKIPDNFSLSAVSALRLVSEFCLSSNDLKYGISDIDEKTRYGFIDAFTGFAQSNTFEVDSARVEEITSWPIVAIMANPILALTLLTSIGYFIPMKGMPKEFRDPELIKDSVYVENLVSKVFMGRVLTGKSGVGHFLQSNMEVKFREHFSAEDHFPHDILDLIKFFDPRSF